MNPYWALYLISIADNFKFFVFCFDMLAVMIMSASLIVIIIVYIDMPNSNQKYINKIIKNFWTKAVIFFLVLLNIINIFIPTSAALAATWVAGSIITNEQISQIPDKVFEVLNIKLDQLLDETQNEEK